MKTKIVASKNQLFVSDVALDLFLKTEINPEHVKIGLIGADRSLLNIGKPKKTEKVVNTSVSHIGIASLFSAGVVALASSEEELMKFLIKFGAIAVSIGAFTNLIGYSVAKTENYIDTCIFHFFKIFQSVSNEQVFKILKESSDKNVVNVFKLAGESAWEDKDLVKLALSKVNKLKEIKIIMDLAKFDAWSDKELVMEAVKQNGLSLEYASEDLKNNKEVVLKALEENGLSFEYTGKDLRNDKIVIMKALERVLDLDVEKIIKIASENLRNNEELIRFVISKNGLALKYASDVLRNNKELIRMALRNSSNSIVVEIMKAVESNIWEDKDLLMLALKQVSTLQDIKAVMELAKFDAWSDREVVFFLLTICLDTDGLEIMNLSKFDVWKDKWLVSLAFNKVSTLQEVKKIMTLADIGSSKDKEFLEMTKRVFWKLKK